MRYALLVGLVVLAVAAVPQLCRAGSFDGVGSTLQPGQISLSAGYWYQQEKWEGTDVTGTGSASVAGRGSIGVSQTVSLSSFTTSSNQGYGQASVGIYNGWEGYLRLGGADIASNSATYLFSDSKPSDGMKLFGTVGINGAVYKDKMFAIGPFAQFTYYLQNYTDSASVSGQFLGATGTATETVTFKNYYTIKAGFAGAVTIQDAVTIYGGPFWNYARATLDFDVTGSGTYQGRAATLIASGDTTVKNDCDIGGMLGVKIPITKALSIGVEGQYAGAWAAGARITYAF